MGQETIKTTQSGHCASLDLLACREATHSTKVRKSTFRLSDGEMKILEVLIKGKTRLK